MIILLIKVNTDEEVI